MEASTHADAADGTPTRVADQWPSEPADRLGPIDVTTGRLVFEEVDFVLAGPFAFSLCRHFASTRTWRDGSLGPGFSHPLDQWLWVEHGWLFLRTTDGREIAVGAVPRGELGIGERIHHPVHGLTVRRIEAQTYLVRDRSGARFFQSADAPTGALPAGASEAARLVRVVQPSGAAAALGYDEAGRLAQFGPEGAAPIQFEIEPTHHRITAVWARARSDGQHAVVARYAYDDAGRLVEATDALGRSSQFAWNARRLVRHTGRNGLITTFAYRDDENGGRCVRADRNDRRVEVHFDPRTRVAVAIGADGVAYAAKVGTSYRPAGGTDAVGAKWERELDETNGAAIAETDRSGRRHELVYDAHGHLSMMLLADGGTVVLEHDEDGQLVMFEDLDNAVSRWGYDSLGLLHARSFPDGTSVIYERDEQGRLLGLTAPGDVRISFVRDGSQRIAAVRSASGERAIRYDTLGRPVEIIDETGAPSRFGYDERGDVALYEVADVIALRFWRDADGRVIRIHGSSVDEAIQRDLDGHVSAVVRPGAATQLSRDPGSRIVKVARDAASAYELGRDGRGDVHEENAFGLAAIYYRRDAEGRITAATCHGERVQVTRDDAGRPIEVRTEERVERLERTRGGALIRAWSDDADVRFERDAGGRVVRERSADAELSSVYGPDGRRVAFRSSLGPALLFDRDAHGDVIRARLDAEDAWEIVFRRDACGREIERALPGGVRVRFERDALGRCTERTIEREGRRVSTVRYGYRGAHLASIDDSSGFSRTFSHDAAGRLLGARLRSGASVERAVHQRIGADGRVIESQGTTYDFDPRGRRTSKSSPDGTTTRYAHDRARFVRTDTSDGIRVSYAYDALGRMVLRSSERDGEQRERRFVWDGLSLLHEREGDELTSWLSVDGELVAKVIGERCFSVLLHPYGTPSELVDEAGAIAWQGDVDLSGTCERSIDRTHQPWRFRGHWEDPETGLAHAWLRVYDPEVGGYLTPCPDGVARGIDLYEYLADPISSTSPLGLGPEVAPWWGHEIPPGLDAELASDVMRALGVSPSPRRTDPWHHALGRWASLMPHAPPAVLGMRSGLDP